MNQAKDKSFFPYWINKIYWVIIILIAFLLLAYFVKKIENISVTLISFLLIIPIVIIGVAYIKKGIQKTTNKYSDWNIILSSTLLIIAILFYSAKDGGLAAGIIFMPLFYLLFFVIFYFIYQGLIKR